MKLIKVLGLISFALFATPSQAETDLAQLIQAFKQADQAFKASVKPIAQLDPELAESQPGKQQPQLRAIQKTLLDAHVASYQNNYRLLEQCHQALPAAKRQRLTPLSEVAAELSKTKQAETDFRQSLTLLSGSPSSEKDSIMYGLLYVHHSTAAMTDLIPCTLQLELAQLMAK